jgi:hypothetical protein
VGKITTFADRVRESRGRDRKRARPKLGVESLHLGARFGEEKRERRQRQRQRQRE